MPLVNVIKYACDVSGRKRSYKLSSDVWHASEINGSFGHQIVWHCLAANEAGYVVAHAKVYQDKARKLKGRNRLYRWDVTPAGEIQSSAHGDCVSLRGAKMVARACANLFKFCNPYCERKHR